MVAYITVSFVAKFDSRMRTVPRQSVLYPMRTLLLRWVAVVSIGAIGPRWFGINYYFSCIRKGLMPVPFRRIQSISYALKLYISRDLVTLQQSLKIGFIVVDLDSRAMMLYLAYH